MGRGGSEGIRGGRVYLVFFFFFFFLPSLLFLTFLSCFLRFSPWCFVLSVDFKEGEVI